MNPEYTEMQKARRAHVERVFQEQGWDNVDEIDDWNGEDLEALREMMTEEQFQALVDQLADAEPRDR